MKNYLLLGLLLLAGLSFASPPEGLEWMGYASNKYGCNYWYSGRGYDYDGLMEIASIYDTDPDCQEFWEGGDYWDCSAMSDDFEDMAYYLYYGEEDICYYSCGGYSREGFRSSLLQYNVYSAHFRAEFLAGARAYLAAHPLDKSEFTSDLRDALVGYRECLAFYDGFCQWCNT